MTEGYAMPHLPNMRLSQSGKTAASAAYAPSRPKDEGRVSTRRLLVEAGLRLGAVLLFAGVLQVLITWLAR